MATRIEELALRMTMAECAEILTYTDEPELLIEPWEEPPVFSPDLIAAARLADAMFAAKSERRH